jgi:hypothetical protein
MTGERFHIELQPAMGAAADASGNTEPRAVTR